MAAQGLETTVKFSSGTAPPRTRAPEDATDCHHHVYDARFPPDPRATLRPPDASPEDYRALQRRLGLSRSVLVTPSTYGTDNRLHLQALQELGPQRTRMVAVVDTSVTDEDTRCRCASSTLKPYRAELFQPVEAVGDCALLRSIVNTRMVSTSAAPHRTIPIS